MRLDQFRLLTRQARRAAYESTDLLIGMCFDLNERLNMTDETVADLKTKYEAFRDVQQAINDLAAEMTSDTANEAAGANAAVMPEVPAVTGE